MISESVIAEIAEAVAGANGRRAAIVRGWARELGVSVKTIYRLLAGRGGKKRKVRSDKGRIHGVDEETLQRVAAVMMESWTEKYRAPIMSAGKAIELGERMGILEPGQLTPWVFNRWLKNNSISKRKLAEATPHQRMRSLWPNQVHQYDVSVCAQWYLRGDGAVEHQRRQLEVYRNKVGKPRQLKRHMLSDHCSGAFFPLYLMSENLRDSLEFLFAGWQGKRGELILETMGIEDRDIGHMGRMGHIERLKRVCEKYCFRGAPDILYTDNGTAVRSAIGKQVMANLGIEYHVHEKGNPRAKASVEGGMWIWERNFEVELKLQPARSLLELNVRALESALKYQTTRRHTRHGMMRFEAWGKIPEGKLRELPEDRKVLRGLAARAHVRRNINYDGTIYFDGKTYKVADQQLWGSKCLVGADIFNVAKCGIIVDAGGEKFKLESLGKDGWGFLRDATPWGEYKSPKHTETQRKTKATAQDLSGYELKDIDVDALPGFGSPAGREIDLDGEAPVKKYTRVGAKREIINRLGWTPARWQMGVIEYELGKGEITDDVIDGVVEKLERKDAEFG